MAGLLSAFNANNGYGLLNPYRTNDPFLASLLDRQRNPQADAADEAMFAANPNGGAWDAVPAQVQPALNQAVMTPQGSAPAQRDRVSPWRALDRVLGGSTISDAIDTERARLQTEADRPAQLAQQQRLAAAVGQLPLPLQVAYAANPQEVGKALASNFEGYTLGSGGLRGGMNGVVASAPTYTTVNDTIYANDRGISTPTVTAPPGYDDRTQRMKAESDARLAALGIDIQRQNADTSRTVGYGNLALAQDKAAQDAENRARATTAQQGEARQVATSMQTALNRARDYVGSAGYWNGRAPLISQVNAQGRANLEGQLDTLKGNLTFEKLMEMKKNSPTGASGLGALSDNEARLLASTAASLSVDMTPEELEKSFQVIDGLIEKSKASSAPPLPPGFVLDQ